MYMPESRTDKVGLRLAEPTPDQLDIARRRAQGCCSLTYCIYTYEWWDEVSNICWKVFYQPLKVLF